MTFYGRRWMSDIRLLLWQKWKRFTYEGRYWLRTIGYDTMDRSLGNRSYAIYLVIFGAFWLIAMWSYIGDQFIFIVQGISDQNRTRLIDAIPLGAVLLQGFFIFRVLNDSPLKLTTNDSIYVAGSPINREAITIVRFLQTVYGRWLVLAPLVTLCIIALAWQIDPETGGRAGLWALCLMVLMVTCWWGMIWIAGLSRFVFTDEQWLFGRGLAFGLIVFGAIPGLLLRELALGSVSIVWLILTAFILIAVFFALNAIGKRLNMTHIVEESRVFARLSDLGPIAIMSAPEVLQDIRNQEARQSSRRRLPMPSARGTPMLIVRAMYAYATFRRIDLVLVAVWGAIVSFLVTLTLQIEDISTLQSWAGILLLVVLIPPRPLVRLFADDQKRPFIRQFIPQNDLMLLLINSAVPLVVLIGSASGVWMWRVGTQPALSVIVLMGLLLTLCMGTDFIRPYQPRGRISYVQSSALSFGISLVAGIFLETFLVTIIGMVVAVGLFSIYYGE